MQVILNTANQQRHSFSVGKKSMEPEVRFGTAEQPTPSPAVQPPKRRFKLFLALALALGGGLLIPPGVQLIRTIYQHNWENRINKAANDRAVHHVRLAKAYDDLVVN